MSVRKLSVKTFDWVFGTDKPQREGNMETEMQIGTDFNDDLEILDSYNREIVGFYNYYSIANNCAHALNNFSYIMEYSMYKRLQANINAAHAR